MQIERERPPRDPKLIAAGVFSAVAMVLLGVIYASSGLVAPAWVPFAFLVIWVLLAMTGLRLMQARSLMVLTVPFFGGGLWLFVIWFGETVLGWTA